MFKIKRVDNLFRKNACSIEYSNLSKQITKLVNENIDYSNKDMYDKTALEQLKKAKLKRIYTN